MIKIPHPPAPNDVLEQLRVLRNKAAHAPDSEKISHALQRQQKQLATALDEEFHNKCAYCEMPIYGGPMVDHFRPKSKFPEFANAWENMFLVCRYCNFSKGARFPTIQIENKSYPALINPSVDEPSEHIRFESDGSAVGITERGKITVETLRLNRKELVADRLQFLKRYRLLIREGSNEALDMLRDQAPFAGFLRQATQRIRRQPNLLTDQNSYVAHADEKYSLSLTKQQREESLSIRYIERITLKNIGSIHHLDVVLREGEADNASWLTILGDNGVGKSTVLKAIAFALMGDKLREVLSHLAVGLLPHSGVGHIIVKLSGVGEVIVQIDKEKNILMRNHKLPQTPILGYGATRLLPTALHGPKEEKPYARLRNLFDPFTPLIYAEKWFRKLSDEQFSVVSDTIVLLLGLPKSSHFLRTETQIVLVLGRKVIALENLSDGYQSIIGLAADIMSVLLKGDQPPVSAEAIVLLDELGAHLHPSWRIRIVSSLRQAFPRVQFIVTTHEPLCLRGLIDGEVAVLRRTKSGKLVVSTECPPVNRLSVDQLLSSELFGLASTRSAEVNAQFARYYELLALSRHTLKQENELNELKKELQDENLLGSTPRERKALLAIDQASSRRAAKVKDVGAVVVARDIEASLNSIFGFAGLKKSVRTT